MKQFTYIFIFFFVMQTTLYCTEQLTVSIVPQMQTFEIQKTWGGFLIELEKQTGLHFELKHYASIPLFEEGLKKGEPDIAFMNPYHTVMAYNWQHYYPIVHDKKQLIGILVVKKDGNIHTLSDLNGKKLAFPAPNAFAASLFMRASLKEDEKISFTPIYVKTHSNVYRDVLFGVYSAGGGVNNTLSRENIAMTSQLKVLYTTKPTAPHPLCVHPRVDKKSIDIIRNAILKMGSDPKYKDILNSIQMPNPVIADYKKEYLPLKKLRLENYVSTEN